MAFARIDASSLPNGSRQMVLSGRWTLATTADRAPALLSELRQQGAAAASWDCLTIEALDSAGAILLWRAWGRAFPASLQIGPDHIKVFERISVAEKQPPDHKLPVSPFERVIDLGSSVIGVWKHLTSFVALIGQLVLDVFHVMRHPIDLPRKEISANVYKSGVMAMPVTALVGFLLGIVLSYLSALQLKQFGADIYIVNILGMGIVRELGPVLVAILVAGRSGSAMTAQLGVMRVTEEIDALTTMGVSPGLRLILPKVLALSIAMPLLVVWTTTIALAGGMVAAQFQLDISFGFFLQTLPRAVPAANLVIALTKGAVFGVFVALVACHFGLRVRPNTESLSVNTTASVVTSITVVILLDAVFAMSTRSIGLPG